MVYISRLFKWAASEQLIPAAVYETLRLIPGLKKGKTEAPESKRVRPISISDVEKTLLHCTPIIATENRLTAFNSESWKAEITSILINGNRDFTCLMSSRPLPLARKKSTRWLNSITANRVAQLMIIGWSFSFLVEGVSGFGTPAALTAPLLVGLGFPPLPVAVLCLMMNAVPVSFGAVGMPTWFGLGNFGLTPDELQEVGFKSALMRRGRRWSFRHLLCVYL